MESSYAVLFICYASYALNRKSVSFITPQLIEEGLDTSHAGLIISCLNAAYALSKFAAGLLSDRTNPKLLFTAGLLVSGLTTLIFSSSSSVTAFCSLWFLNGLAQGCGWPSCAKILRQKASPAHFGTLWSILSSSNNFAGSISPFLFTYITFSYGWRMSVLVSGVISVFLVMVCFIGLESSPCDRTKQKQTEVKKRKLKKEEDEPHNSESFADLLQDPFLWLVSVGFLVALGAKTALVDWGQLYLMEEQNRSQLEASAFTSSVETGGFVGRIAAGYLTDYFVQRHLSSFNTVDRSSRISSSTAKSSYLRSSVNKKYSKSSIRVFVSVFFLMGSVFLTHLLRVAVTDSTSTAWLTTLGFALGICLFGPIAIYGISASESAPSYLSGSAHAIAAFGGNVGAILSGFPCCYVAKHHSWSSVMLLLQVIMVLMSCAILCCTNLQPKYVKLEKED